MPKLGKKAKGKAAKKPAIDETPEERLVRMEMEALAAEERARKEDEASRVALRAQQLREQQYSHINAIKIHNQWRKIMRMTKVEELRKEIEILSQNHEREVDRKDAIIQMLDRDLEDAEDQYQMALRGHLRIVDQLLELQYTRMKALREEFERQLRALENEFGTERTEILNHHTKQRKDMADLMAAMNGEFEGMEQELRQEFEGAREEIKNKNSEEYNVLKISLEATISELELHFKQAHDAYLQSTDSRTQNFRELTKRDAAAARIIERRMRKLVRLQEAIAHWKTKLATNAREWEERNRALRHEKEIMNRHYQTLKGSMDAFRAAQADRLKQLTIQTTNAAGDLKGKLRKAEHILKLAELCRKFETEQEKILPFTDPANAIPALAPVPGQGMGSTLEGIAEEPEGEEAEDGVEAEASRAEAEARDGGAAAPAEEADGKLHLSSYGLDEKGGEVEEWDYLNKFFRRYNKALLDEQAVARLEEQLDRENADLRAILKQYLDGISVNEDVINDAANPLLIVNQRLQLTLKERAKAAQSPAPPPPQTQTSKQLVEVQADGGAKDAGPAS